MSVTLMPSRLLLTYSVSHLEVFVDLGAVLLKTINILTVYSEPQ